MPSNRIAPRKPMALTAAAVFVSVWTPCRQTFNSQFIGRRLHALATAASPTSKPCTVRTRTRRYIATMIGSGNGDGRDIGAETGIIPADLKQEMTNSYMEYAMSVILGRAMPDVRDGLKPVHRRILFAMHELGLAPTSSFRKSARVVGEVLGKYHPHGDTAVYDALVRMAQGFSMSVPLVNGHGNFGSTDGDPAAAMRYTECKLSPMAKDAFLSDMDRDTVSYVANFDGSEREPLVLPVKVPNLLVNGSSGIAVGMATNIPPHNLGELVSALTALIEEPDISDEQLFELVPGPDFPTGGQILGVEGARDMYKTGKGRIVVRACAHSEVLDGEKRRQTRDAIVVTELPYQVNKAVLVSKIADLVNEKKLEGVSDLRDESDRNGTRIVIELKRDAKVPVVLNNLYKKTQLQSSFSANVMALDNGRFPVRLTLRDCLEKFLTFRKETVRRRVKFDLDRAEKRLHLVDGLLIVQSNIDAVVATIKASSDSVSARKKLMGVFELSIEQAGSVLDMQLRRLTSLEYKRLQDEWNGLQKKTSELRDTLATGSKVDSIILKELEESAEKFAAKRRSVILEGNNLEAADINELSLMSNERSVITVTEQGYIKRMATSSFESQNRGTRGKRGVGRLRAGDKIAHLFSCMTHDSLIAVSTSGTAYQLPAHKVPLGSLSSRGVPLFQLLPGVPAGETMAAVMAVTEEEEYLVLLTQCGFVKKTAVKELRSISARGKRVIALDAGDVLKWVKSCCGKDSLVIGSQNGVFIRFRTDERNLRASGRSSRGVRSIRLDEDDEIADMDVVSEREIEEERGADGDGKFLLAVTKDGTGKRIRAEGFRCQGRGGRGVKGITLGNGRRKDRVVALQTCAGNDSVMLVTSDGTIVRTRVGKIPVQGRYSRGVRIQRLGQRDRVAAVTVLRGLLADDEEEDGEEEEGEEEEGEEEDGEAADGEQDEDEGDQEGGGV